jgi:hypothetical protein
VPGKGIAATNGFFQFEDLSLDRLLAGLLRQGRRRWYYGWRSPSLVRASDMPQGEGSSRDAWRTNRRLIAQQESQGGNWRLGTVFKPSRQMDALRYRCGERSALVPVSEAYYGLHLKSPGLAAQCFFDQAARCDYWWPAGSGCSGCGLRFVSQAAVQRSGINHPPGSTLHLKVAKVPSP